MTFIEAAHEILSEVGEPLHYKEITERALAKGLVATQGKTPWETLNAQLATHIKRHGSDSPFMRTAPGVFALSSWGLAPVVQRELLARVAHLPSWAALRGYLRSIGGRSREQLTALRGAIGDLKGENHDFTQPGVWIPALLEGGERDFAMDLWKGSSGALNPRYVSQVVGIANRHDLVEEDDHGILAVTERGRDFVDHPSGVAVRELDAAEGVARVLALVAEHGPESSSGLGAPFFDWCVKHTGIQSERTARVSLRSRLTNLLERGLVDKTGHSYAITPDGLAHLGQEVEALVDNASDEDKDELFDLVREINEQQHRVRARIREALYDMDPYAFEHLVKRLLDEMGYDDVEVTKASGDKGVDVVGRIQVGITPVTEVIQAKRQKGNVGRQVLDALRGSLYRWSAQRGTIITTASFSKGARDAAFDIGAAPIQLIDGDRLVRLLVDHGIGVNQQPVKLWRFDPEPFSGGALPVDSDHEADEDE